MNDGAGGTRRRVRQAAITAALAGRGPGPEVRRVHARARMPGFPDPVVNSGGVELHGPAGLKPNSPQFQSAQQACRKLLPGGGP
jgi:hypothetical protein